MRAQACDAAAAPLLLRSDLPLCPADVQLPGSNALPRVLGSARRLRRAVDDRAGPAASAGGSAGRPMLIGYLRGRAGDEGSLHAQRKALADAGGEQVVEDLAVGHRWEQPELRRVLDALQAGDVVVVTQ